VKTAFLLLILTSTVAAQISPEEAQRRLDERRAQAATRPVDTSIIPELRLQIATLQKEVTRLKAENATLTRELADRQRATTQPAPDAAAAPVTAPSPTLAANPNGKLRLGMTVDEANTAMGAPGKLVGEGRGWQQFEWPVAPVNAARSTGADADQPQRPTIPTASIFARFENGALTSYAKR